MLLKRFKLLVISGLEFLVRVNALDLLKSFLVFPQVELNFIRNFMQFFKINF